jgi:serine/threonine-protein kinase/endoribonuclease IRE1
MEENAAADARLADVLAVGRVLQRHAPAEPLLTDLVSEMMDENPGDRPFPVEVLRHPFLWPATERIDFLCQLSEFLRSSAGDKIGQRFESKRREVAGADWTVYLDRELLVEATQHKSYTASSVAELVRFFRNKWMHVPVDASGARLAVIGITPEDYFQYYHERFPNLFLYCYYFADVSAPNLL